MALLPCQLHPEQLDVLCNTVPGSYPARPIMMGRMAIDALIVPIVEPLPEVTIFSTTSFTLSYDVLHAGRRRETVTIDCPFGKPGTQLWIQEELQIQAVLHPTEGRAVRVMNVRERRGQIMHLDERDPDYHAGQTLLTPRIEWAGRELLLVREVHFIRLRCITEEWAKRLGAGAALETSSGLQRRSHLAGFKLWWAAWHGRTAWIDNQKQGCWIATFERTFKEEVT